MNVVGCEEPSYKPLICKKERVVCQSQMKEEIELVDDNIKTSIIIPPIAMPCRRLCQQVVVWT